MSTISKNKSTGEQTRLKTSDKAEAQRLLNAHNESEYQPQLNMHLARVYLSAGNGSLGTRTWQEAMDAVIEMKRGSTKERWLRAGRDKAFDSIRKRPLLETQAEHFLQVLKAGTVSTNVHLRKLHKFCVDMNWLLCPVLPKKQCPPVEYQEKRAITLEEHQRILAVERNPELHAFYSLCWHLGGAQSDIACLTADNIDWRDRVISFNRKKTDSLSVLHFGEEVARLLKTLPSKGALFPRVSLAHEKHRAKDFKRRCKGLGISGVTLHSYRYAWAERAKSCGYPERFAQEALGHNSKAVHRAYARKAQVKLPALKDYEKAHAVNNIIPLNIQTGVMQESSAARSEKLQSEQSLQDAEMDICAI